MANILLVITGGVRATRQWDLTRRFQAEGHVVRCVTTGSALLFLIPFYLRRPWRCIRFLQVWHSPLGELVGYLFHRPGGVPHINTAKWADVVVIAPATCNSLSKLVSGITDSFAMLIVRAAARSKTVLVVPSMNTEMWFDPFVQQNIDRLNRTRKYGVVAPRLGKMRSGDVGPGAMAAEETIVDAVRRALATAILPVQQQGSDDLKPVGAGDRAEPPMKARLNANGSELPGLDESSVRMRPSRSAGAELAGDDHVAAILLVDSDTVFSSHLTAVVEADYPSLRLIVINQIDGIDDAIERILPAAVIINVDIAEDGFVGQAIDDLVKADARLKLPVIAIGERTRSVSNWEKLALLGISYIPKPLEPHFLFQTVIGHLTVGNDPFR